MKRAIALSIAGSMLAATSAFAHATLDRTEAPADSFYKAVFGIGHGCDGQPTLRVRVRIPEGITSVKPQPKAGWELTIRREKVPQPLTGTHGVPVTEVVTEVMWSGKLPDDNFDEFLIQVRLPNKAGQTLYFPPSRSARPPWSAGSRFRQQASSGGITPILRRRLRSPPRGIKQVSCSALPMSVVGLGRVKTRRLGRPIEWIFRQIAIRVARILKRGRFRSIWGKRFYSSSSFRRFHTARVNRVGSAMSAACPLYLQQLP